MRFPVWLIEIVAEAVLISLFMNMWWGFSDPVERGYLFQLFGWAWTVLTVFMLGTGYLIDPRWVEVSINTNGVTGGAAIFHLETQSQDLANHILMFSYLKSRIKEVGEDQAREEFQTIIQEGLEEAERDRNQKNGANVIRTKTVKKP